MELLTATNVSRVGIGLLAYLVLRTVYRLYWHPLSQVPGPKLAAISSLYEFYYNCIQHGQYHFQLIKMHKQYGPIVRVGPNEVHIIDPTFYEEIYSGSTRRRNKTPQYGPQFGMPDSLFSTIDHAHHHARRATISHFFSKRSIQSLSPITERCVLKLMQRLQEFYEADRIVRLDDAFAAMTSDVITYYSYGESQGFLEDATFRSEIRTLVNELAATSHLNRFIPVMSMLLRRIPPRWLAALQPSRAATYDYLASIYALSAQSATPEAAAETDRKPTKHATIFAQLSDPSIPASERTRARFQDEAVQFLLAGTETTSSILTYAAYILGSRKDYVERLRAELRTVLPTPTSTASWTELEKLPFLTAIITESLRLAPPIIRLPRVAPTETLVYNGYKLPPGTVLGASAWFIHRDPTLFPEGDTFDPERWLQGEKSEHLKRYMVAFSKGSRGCVGINLAYNELYLALAYFVRRFEFELFDTTPEDMEMVAETVLQVTRRGFPTVYVRITAVVGE
ncbi:cytochrome P450 [Aspergillus brunneoviolaceus CBS 621.78]|uniref:Benzoate 4-monooxygenase cytochrome P450 n=1 Tax=Aspergillus brunneoviolaceus CBS 621.78 TaxID=1450534 RepID=A0ACD1GAK0_9EURO|nr:benzoate 4-monooxygenase cytochrome P450 [Aspergillus brunneoviolaceus CBS 621.78]RAH46232.1 benzoate 4-monooxygenase cytochrome P450 [Aspergillus brunneoviolaceus CBS 621.78]